MNCKCIKSTQKRLEPEKNALSSVFSEYCSKSSIHGIGYLGDKGNTLEKIWWILMFVFSVTICTVQIVKTWEKWNSNPVITSVSKNQFPTWQIPFPAVTICPFNKIDRKRYHYREQFLRRFHLSENDFSKFWDVALLCNEYTFNFNRTTNENVLDNIRQVTTSSPSIVDASRLNGKLIKFYNHITADGMCYTYNSFSQKDMYTDQLNPDIIFIESNTTNEGWSIENGYPEDTDSFTTYPSRTKDGVKSGMRIRLQSWSISREYACGDPISGYKITLHNPAEYPKVGQQYILAPLKKAITISVEPKVVTTTDTLQELPVHTRNCYFSKEKSLKFFKVYTQINCRMECLTNVTKEICGCVAYYMPREIGTKICGIVSCVSDVESEIIPEFDVIKNKSKIRDNTHVKAFDIYEKCNCLPSCASLSYDYDTSQADYEWQKGFESKTDIHRAQIPLNWFEHTYVDIFFKDPSFMPLQRGELYGQTDFLANCGGLLGLFMGFSFISFIEIVYFFTVRLWCKLKHNEIVLNTYNDQETTKETA